MADERRSQTAPESSPIAPAVWRDDERSQLSALSSRTVAALRAVDSEDPTVPFDEPLAAWLAGDDWLQRIRQVKQASDQYAKGLISDVSLRCMALDEAVLKACQGPARIKQVVLLGAGMDTRAYRLALADVAWFEVDLAAISDLKQSLLEQVPASLRPHRNPCTGALEHLKLDISVSVDALLPALQTRGFDATAPVLYVMEGLLYYLSKQENQALFQQLSAPAGSLALLTCIPAALIRVVNDPQVQQRVPRYRAIAPAWKTDLEGLIELLEPRWKILEQVNLSDFAEHRGLAVAGDKELPASHREVAERYLSIVPR
jgi:methyltransferase (TIGR00027 family)